jgi:hypothetical protein
MMRQSNPCHARLDHANRRSPVSKALTKVLDGFMVPIDSAAAYLHVNRI